MACHINLRLRVFNHQSHLPASIRGTIWLLLICYSINCFCLTAILSCSTTFAAIFSLSTLATREQFPPENPPSPDNCFGRPCLLWAFVDTLRRPQKAFSVSPYTDLQAYLRRSKVCRTQEMARGTSPGPYTYLQLFSAYLSSTTGSAFSIWFKLPPQSITIADRNYLVVQCQHLLPSDARTQKLFRFRFHFVSESVATNLCASSVQPVFILISANGLSVTSGRLLYCSLPLGYPSSFGLSASWLACFTVGLPLVIVSFTVPCFVQ